jgi:hypothetical protein
MSTTMLQASPRRDETFVRFSALMTLRNLCWLLVAVGVGSRCSLKADPPLTAGITSVGTNIYPYTNKPVAGSQINWSRSLSANLVSAVPLNEGSGTNFYDAVSQQSYTAKILQVSLTFDTSIAERAPLGSAFAPAVHKQGAQSWVTPAVRSSLEPVRLWRDPLGWVES